MQVAKDASSYATKEIFEGDPNLQVAKDASSYASKRGEIFEGDPNLQVANADESSYAQ